MTLIPWVIPIRVVDLLEIGLVAYILYKLYQLMRGTIAVQIFVGILALYLIQLMVTAADMTILRALFGSISEVFVLAVIILFQPEIRRLLLLLGQNPLVRRFMRSPAQQERIGEIVGAVKDLSQRRIGALIVFERSTGLRSYIETGAQLHAQVSRDLLVTIFYAQNPLHDGAVIIRDARIEAARCMDAGVLRAVEDADVGAILGWGFAPYTGGPLSYIDQIGVAQFVARADELAAAHGARFEPPALLRRMAAEGTSFYA